MRYVIRDDAYNVVTHTSRPVFPDQEALADDHADILAHEARVAQPRLLSKLSVAQRLTADEAALVRRFFNGEIAGSEAAGTAAGLEWMSAEALHPDAPETVARFEALFGAARAVELLAPE